MLDTDDTIVALASAPGSGARGIVRLSGPKSLEIVDQIFFAGDLRPVQRTHLIHGTVALKETFGNFPALCLRWPSERSYTGQPVAELHLLGVMPIVEQVIAELVRFGARLARPGEFTLRAFLAGRLDLAQCEAVLAVIDAQGDQELRDALNQLAGGLTSKLDDIRNRLLDALAEIEAGLDFADEDLELIPAERLRFEVQAALDAVSEAQLRMNMRHLSGTRPRVALVGYPNAGKSSLLNQLVGEAAAIVSPIAGTTRDWVSVVSPVTDRVVEWLDTAGIDPLCVAGPIDQAAQQATHDLLQSVDLILICVDVSEEGWRTKVETLVRSIPPHRATLIVFTKADLRLGQGDNQAVEGVHTSSVSQLGIDLLKQQVVRQLTQSMGNDRTSFVQSTAQRCTSTLAAAAESLKIALELVGTGSDELLAGELRLALDAIGEVTGRVYTDDVLDRVFSKFCIGK